MIKKILTDDLQLGMHVHDFNAPWLNHPFLTSHKKLRTAAELELIRKHGIREVYIDTGKGSDSPKAFLPHEAAADLLTTATTDPAVFIRDTPEIAGPRGPKVPVTKSEEVPFDEELRKAHKVYDHAKQTVKDICAEARLGKVINGESAKESVSGMIDSIFRNRDALLSLARLKSHDDYTFQHSLNVAVLSLNLGSHLGILQRELLHLGIGALLHDLGKVFLPDSILNKPGPLTRLERAMVEKHPDQGARLLEVSDSVPDECATVARNHHERYDGSGYPNALSGLQPGKFGLIAAIADVYDAMTTNRAYQRRVPPHLALKRVYEWSGSFFHPIYVRKFIQCLGIYPTGTVVRLDNGCIGVVLKQNRGELLRPWVRLCRKATGEPIESRMDLDLRHPEASDALPGARDVSQVLDPHKAGVDPDRVLHPLQQSSSAPLTVVMG